jgi:hypothetical protein
MCLKLQSLTFRLPSLRQSRRPALENKMEKLDFKKELAELYNPKNRDWEVVDVPAMNFQSMIWHSTGRHHEIYLSDPRKTVPTKLKTILQQPVRHL